MIASLARDCLAVRAELIAEEPGPKHLDRLGAERHVEGCEACRLFLSRERETAAALREAAAWEAAACPPARVEDLGAPAAARVRIEAKPWRRVARAAIPAAAAVLLAGVLAAVLTSGRGTSAVVEAVFEDHAKYLTAQRPVDVLSSDPATISSWSRRELGWAPRVKRPAGFDLLGARRCTIAGNRAALLFYQKGSCRVSLLVGNASRWPPLPPRAALGDTTLVSAVHENLAYVAIGDLDADGLTALLPRPPAL